MEQDFIKEMIDSEKNAISNIDVDSIVKACDLIAEIYDNKKKVIISGIGKAGHIAELFSKMLCSVKIKAVFLHPTEAQHGDMGIIGENDLLILISNSGKTREVIELIEISKNLNFDNKYMLMTSNIESDLKNVVDHIIPINYDCEIGDLKLAPTTSTTVMKVMCDLIISVISKRVNLTYLDYYKIHHSGYLGELSKKLMEKS